MKFMYSSGQRVLDSYTLKRGIGRGGFGEVYYALSDGGKEVALKLVRGNNLDVELRGMAQCLNLKHPNLLTLYDIRADAQGDHWIVMEYITGEPLSNVLSRHPQGLLPDMTRQWFTDMAKGIAYLHSHGIVHRDLKPGNLFVECGLVKVGDYGLCKFISSSQHAAQTQSIGTVHYMAPEISTGNYNKQIDVYASGVILYEMLTGHVPFDGESAGEILMKHLTSPPDLSKLPVAYAPVVGKALAKNPSQRFVSMAEMVKAVENVGGPAQPAPARVAVATPVPPVAPALSTPVRVPAPAHESVATATYHPAPPRAQVAELCGSLTMATLFAAVATAIWAAISRDNTWSTIGSGFFLTVAICWAVLIPAKVWNGHVGDTGYRRIIMLLLGVAVGLGALWLDNGTIGISSGTPVWTAGTRDPKPFKAFGERTGIPVAAGYLSYFGLALFAVRWWKFADRHRCQRFSFGPILVTAFWAFILLVVWPWSEHEVTGTLPLLLSSAIVQLVSPWEPSAPPPVKRMRLRYT
jgi:hypothetical protein